MKTIPVALGARSYTIEIDRGLLSQIGAKLYQLTKGKQVAVITDENVRFFYGAMVQRSLEDAGFKVLMLTIPPGENSKSWQTAENLLGQLLKNQYHRDCSVIALGGGVVGDLAGFVASIYQRGVGFYQIPTSLLAQVDSSVGGKVAVNHQLGKNMIGSFYQPRAVWIDLDTLKTLEPRHWTNAMAEVIKYGMINDADFLQFLRDHAREIEAKNHHIITEMIAWCCTMKAKIVAIDEQEAGIRAILNFGHTIGHGLEKAGDYTYYLHGEAIAIGMVLVTKLAIAQGRCTKDVLHTLVEILHRYQLPTSFAAQFSNAQILSALALDKKVENEQWVFILPTGIGQVEKVSGIKPGDVEQILQQNKEVD